MPNPTGHIKHLSNGRLAFVGREGMEGDWYIAFRNSKGEDTKIQLSSESLEAFVELIALRKVNPGTQDFPHKRVWRLIPGQTEGETADSEPRSPFGPKPSKA